MHTNTHEVNEGSAWLPLCTRSQPRTARSSSASPYPGPKPWSAQMTHYPHSCSLTRNGPETAAPSPLSRHLYLLRNRAELRDTVLHQRNMAHQFKSALMSGKLTEWVVSFTCGSVRTRILYSRWYVAWNNGFHIIYSAVHNFKINHIHRSARTLKPAA